MVLHHECFHIRKSPDRSLFATPRSLSQLVTSFIGSWCQGIHLMLLFAWTSYLLVLVLLNCLSFIKQFLFFRISFAVKRFYPFHFRKLFFYSTFRWNCSLPKFFGKTYSNLIKNMSSFICSFLLFFTSFIRFSMNAFFLGSLLESFFAALAAGRHKWTRTTDLALIRRAL